MTKGLAAMEMMYKEKPNEYVRTVLSVMPYNPKIFRAGLAMSRPAHGAGAVTASRSFCRVSWKTSCVLVSLLSSS
jgi:hypothetical protein